MTDTSDKSAAPGNDAQEKSPQPDRRGFMTGMSAAALGGAMIGSAAAAEAPKDNADIKAPKGLGPKAMLDNRFPESYRTSVPMATKVIIEHFTALSQRDLKGVAASFHFPFVTWERTDAVHVTSEAEFMAKAPASVNMTMNPERFSDHDGYLMPGCYDVFEGLEILCMDPVNVGLSMSYMRYDDRGRKLHRCQGIYSVCNNDGRWAIQSMSTIFTPADMLGVWYPDAEEAAHRLRMDHDLAYNHSDRRYEPDRAEGASGGYAGVGGAPWSAAPAGRAMNAFKVAGVKSRLSWNDGTKPQPKPMPSANPVADYADYRKLFPTSGVGNWGWVIGRLPNARVLHTAPDKAHTFCGAIRFTTSGEEASHNSNLSVTIYQQGRWFSAGNMAYTTPHDRSNDMLRS